ncbi:Helix-turn-helix domain-containing protein [Dyadobacter koreensis]|uniref:Helix-turn-helix domain-containing protein n=2 Tax=Dyadobacter koreensis TaxID=408657 RepID=A0A1H6WI12_9BACT|nr:Helix-turn-helix domain-containing protein [Dyadobacter koreensis]
MSSSSDMTKNIHQGRNVKRFREMMSIKQEALAYELGGDWTQKRVSLLEQKETIEKDILDQIANILKVPADAIKNFDEETAIFNIQNNYEGSNASTGTIGIFQNCDINPVEKLFQVLEENKLLYERLLKAEQDKNELLTRIVEGKLNQK